MNVIHEDRRVSWTACATCHGVGELYRAAPAASGFGMIVYSCPACHGTGQITSTRGVSLPPLIPAGERKDGAA